MTEKELRNLNTAVLAFMGDAVYGQAVRERMILDGNSRVDRLHRESTRYVSAPAQARVIKGIYDDLTDEEKALVKRARNHRYHSTAKNSDPMTYKWASAFEALIGYLHLGGDNERLEWVLARSFEIIESRSISQTDGV